MTEFNRENDRRRESVQHLIEKTTIAFSNFIISSNEDYLSLSDLDLKREQREWFAFGVDGHQNYWLLSMLQQRKHNIPTNSDTHQELYYPTFRFVSLNPEETLDFMTVYSLGFDSINKLVYKKNKKFYTRKAEGYVEKFSDIYYLTNNFFKNKRFDLKHLNISEETEVVRQHADKIYAFVKGSDPNYLPIEERISEARKRFTSGATNILRDLGLI